MSNETLKPKIGILTYHDGFNFGAFLQVYALQRALEDLGLFSEESFKVTGKIKSSTSARPGLPNPGHVTPDVTIRRERFG